MIQWWITSGIVGIFLGSICFKDCTGICHAPLRSRTQRDYPPDGFESTSGYPRRSLFRDHRLWWVTSLSVRLLDWSTAGIYLIVFAEHMSVLYKRNVNKRQSAYYLIGTSLALIGLITAVCALHYTYLFFSYWHCSSSMSSLKLYRWWTPFRAICPLLMPLRRILVRSRRMDHQGQVYMPQ